MKKIIDKVYQFSNLIAISPSCTCIIEDIIDDIVEEWNLIFGALLINKNNQTLKTLSCSKTPIQESYLSYLEKSEKIHQIFNTIKSDWDSSYTYQETTIGNAQSGLLIFPMWTDNYMFGAICLFKKDFRATTIEDVQLLQIITNQLGMAIEKEALVNNFEYLENWSNSILDSFTEGIVLANHENIQYINKTALKFLEIERISSSLNKEEFILIISDKVKNKLEMEMYFEMADRVPNFYFICETTSNRFLRINKFQIRNELSNDGEWGFYISDITMQIKFEELRDNLLAIVSHELRTPLTSIKGNVSSLIRQDVEWSSDAQKEFLQDINEECDRLNEMIGKLLDQSKISAGVLTLDKSQITIGQLMNKVQRKVESYYRCSYKIIDFQLEHGNEVINIDEDKLLQVMFNLIQNAIKYKSRDPKINVYLGLKDGDLYSFVKDNGPGISEQDLTEIFKRYYRVDCANSFGSGLGLFICKGFVEIHGGRIWAESEIGVGSTFHILIPNGVKE